MKRSKIKVGIDIGNTKTAIAAGKLDRHGNLIVLGVETSTTLGVKEGRLDNIQGVRTMLQSTIYAIEETIQEPVSEVYLSVSGEKVRSMNHSEVLPFQTKRVQITDEHTQIVAQRANQRLQNEKWAFLHQTPKYFKLDDRKCISPPIGKLGRKLEAHAHLVYGEKQEIYQYRNLFQQDLGIRVLDFVYTPIADTVLLLSDEDKRQGVLLIDIGGYHTDFALFCDGALEHTGTVNFGGIAITQDIVEALKIPIRQAEQLKMEHAIASETMVMDEPELVVEYEDLFMTTQNTVVDHHFLNDVVYCRAMEILELVRQQIPTELLAQVKGGVHLTGGTSQLKGIATLAATVFGLEVYQVMGEQNDNIGDLSKIDNPTHESPENSTVLGLLQYAHYVDSLEATERKGGLSGWIGKIFSGG